MKSRESLVRTFSAEMMKKWHQLCNNASQLFETKTFGLQEQEIRPHMIKTENFDVILKNTVVTICLIVRIIIIIIIITIIIIKLYKTFKYVPSQKRAVLWARKYISKTTLV